MLLIAATIPTDGSYQASLDMTTPGETQGIVQGATALRRFSSIVGLE
jgi:hypothetical protein